MYCTTCECEESACTCGHDGDHVEDFYCEHCGSIGEEDDFNQDSYCYEDECQEAHEEYRDSAVNLILGLSAELLK